MKMKWFSKIIILVVAAGGVIPAFACHSPARPIPYRLPVYTCHHHHCHDGVLGATLNLVGSLIGCGRTCCDRTTTVVQPVAVVENAPVVAPTYHTSSHLTTAMIPLVTVPGVTAGNVQTAPVIPTVGDLIPVQTKTKVFVPGRYVVVRSTYGELVQVWQPSHYESVIVNN